MVKRTYKKKVEWYKKAASLNQAICSGLEFAFVSKKFAQICPFVLCKDYLQDAVFNQLYKTKKTIYGFHFTPQNGFEIDMGKTRLVIANSQDKNLRTKIPALMDFLHQIEKLLKITKTQVRECAKPPIKYAAGGVWLLEGSKRWMHSPPMLSLYTMLIRVGFSHTAGNDFWNTINGVVGGSINAYQIEDRDRLRSSIDGIKRILAEGDRKIFARDIKKNYPRGTRIQDMHDHLGICSFSKGYTKSLVPIWHE
jgi:hypothetical protein